MLDWPGMISPFSASAPGATVFAENVERPSGRLKTGRGADGHDEQSPIIIEE
jgi:hypothetical protein